MRIVMDIREACSDRRTGKGQWAAGVLHELLRRGVPVTGYTDRAVPPPFVNHPFLVVRSLSRGWRWHVQAALAARREEDALYLSPTSFIVPALLGRHVPCVPVVHDLIAWSDATHERRATLIERLTLGRALRSAAHVFTVSETTKRALVGRFPEVQDDHLSPVFAGPLREHPSENTPDGITVLSAGTLSPRKNQLRLIQAFDLLPEPLRSRTRLVLIGGRGWKDEEIVRRAAQTRGVVWEDYVPEMRYEELLTSCTVLAQPSLDEGFGLQILDALQRGCAVLTSARGAIREVCGNAAYYVDPEDPRSIAAGLSLLLGSERIRFDLRQHALAQAKHFSWKRTGDLFLAALERVQGASPARS